ncbi:MAG: phosphoglucosamine mutase [Thermoleophilaceae bacterium]|nr:phosphoglucosamine mutase [Thermoleophilaceae bacterium]
MGEAPPATPPRRLFGTDGVRGVAGEFLSAELALALGRAATAESPAPAPQVLVIRDTRESGEMLEAAFAAGVAAAGGQALLGGVLPTPAAALLVRRYGFDLAAVISASHNPYRDNGIKLFGSDGMKLSDADEARIEESVRAAQETGPPPPPARGLGRIRTLHGADGDYLRELQSRFRDLDLSGKRIVLDCANGATYRVAPEIFRRLGADVETVGAEPDGRNINAGCGSTHIERLRGEVAERGLDLGFAFDGDGDRVLAVDRRGEVVDGDELIALAALHLKRVGRLPGPGVAVTLMTNLGFHHAMRDAGIEVATTQVGDRYVIAELVKRGWALGGEQSGHIIETGFVPSGDGIASALLTLEALGDRDLSDRDAMRKLPQTLVNVRVANRGALEQAAAVWEAVEREQRELGDRGRVNVRPSGTEPVVRVMVESPDAARCEAVAGRLAALIERELG